MSVMPTNMYNEHYMAPYPHAGWKPGSWRLLDLLNDMRSVLAGLCILIYISSARCFAAESPEQIASPEQLLDLLADARTIEITGNSPPNRSSGSPIVRYPVRLSDPEKIRRFADFFRGTELHFDETYTRELRKGAAICCDERAVITINGKYFIEMLGSDMVVFADLLIYAAPETPGPLWSYLHMDFAFRVAELLKPPRASKIRKRQ